MQNALYVAGVGLEAQQQELNASSNNFANLNTTAFKRQYVDFSALLDRPTAGANLGADGRIDSVPLSILRTDMTPGTIRATGRALDVAISGQGFIEVELPDNAVGYTRGGSLQINADGLLTLPTGEVLKDEIRVPGGATGVQVQPDGSVTVLINGDASPRVLGRIELVTFSNTDSLQFRGNGIFTQPDGGPSPGRARPGEGGTQPLAVASLENSNVDMTNEMVSLTVMQRVYELNSRVAQVADELMSLVNNMRRG
jgi:flagellar basal-body rod protein FlgG